MVTAIYHFLNNLLMTLRRFEHAYQNYWKKYEYSVENNNKQALQICYKNCSIGKYDHVKIQTDKKKYVYAQ